MEVATTSSKIIGDYALSSRYDRLDEMTLKTVYWVCVGVGNNTLGRMWVLNGDFVETKEMAKSFVSKLLQSGTQRSSFRHHACRDR